MAPGWNGETMPVTFTIDHAKRFVHASAEGDVRLKHIEAFLDAVVIGNALPYRKLFDARKAIGKYIDNDITLLAARVSLYAHIDRRGALAILTAPQHLELAARFLNLGKSGRPARSFRQEDEAMRWLEEQPEV
jgi:hypothetical protein